METDLPAAFLMADELGNDSFFQEFVGYEDEDPKAFRAAVEGLLEGARRTELMKLIK